MTVPVKVPSAGESVHEGMIETWHKSNGEYVEQDELLLEIETDKSTQEIFAEASGQLKILKEKGSVVKVGETIAELDAVNKPLHLHLHLPTKKEAAKVESSQTKKPTSEELNNGPAVNRLAQRSSQPRSSNSDWTWWKSHQRRPGQASESFFSNSNSTKERSSKSYKP